MNLVAGCLALSEISVFGAYVTRKPLCQVLRMEQREILQKDRNNRLVQLEVYFRILSHINVPKSGW